MKFIKLLKKNKEAEPKTYDVVYGSEVEKKIRERYSLSAELAILRQKDEKPEEWKAYNAYCEQCKSEIKKIVYEEVSS
jgi:hypothetical protein